MQNRKLAELEAVIINYKTVLLTFTILQYYICKQSRLLLATLTTLLLQDYFNSISLFVRVSICQLLLNEKSLRRFATIWYTSNLCCHKSVK